MGNKDEFLQQINSLPQVDLMDKKTTKYQAIKFCYEFMKALYQNRAILDDLTREEDKLVANILKSKSNFHIKKFNDFCNIHKNYCCHVENNLNWFSKYERDPSNLTWPLTILGNGISNFGYTKGRMFLDWMHYWTSDILIPYRKVAMNSLISWNGLSKEEAFLTAISYSTEELAKKCNIDDSVNCVIKAISKICNLSLGALSRFEPAIYGKYSYRDRETVVISPYSDDWTVFNNIIQEEWEKYVKKSENPKRIIEILEAVHNNWVETNADKFNKDGRENKRFQHLPIELIGFEEAKLDLLFAKPILEAIKVEVNEELLEKEYNKRVKKFFIENNLNSEEDLKNYILDIQEKYSSVSEVNSTKDESIAAQMAKQVIERLPKGTKQKVDTRNDNF